MDIRFTEQFDEAYVKLTREEKRQVQKALAYLGDNPKHPGLRVKKMGGTPGVWEARASEGLRMTFQMAGDVIIMRNVGKHDDVLRRPDTSCSPQGLAPM